MLNQITTSQIFLLGAIGYLVMAIGVTAIFHYFKLLKNWNTYCALPTLFGGFSVIMFILALISKGH